MDIFCTKCGCPILSESKCPKCGSNEGFWLAANREKSYAQCKHCGAVLEFCEVLSYTDKDKRSRSAFKKLKF
jgi:transcription initiation factor TFIIIB Brf1 subunit/transcription initiation factor TFIIB